MGSQNPGYQGRLIAECICIMRMPDLLQSTEGKAPTRECLLKKNTQELAY